MQNLVLSIQTISHPRWSTYSWIEYIQSDPLRKTRCMNQNMHCTQYSSTWAQTMNAAMEIQVHSQTRSTKFLLLTITFLVDHIASKFSSFYLPAYLGDSCIPAPKTPITHIKSVANSRLTNGVIMWLHAENKTKILRYDLVYILEDTVVLQKSAHALGGAPYKFVNEWALFQVFMHLTMKDYLCMFRVTQCSLKFVTLLEPAFKAQILLVRNSSNGNIPS